MAFTYGTIWATGVPGNAANMNKDLCGYGLYSEFPAAAAYVSTASPGNVGMIAHATDRNLLYRSNGTSWVCIGISLPSSSASGTIFYFDGTKVEKLLIGSAAQVLTVSGGLPAWGAAIYHGPETQSDVTSSRVMGTVYQNTHATPMIVSIALSGSNNTTSSAAVDAKCDNNASPSLIVGKWGNSQTGLSGSGNGYYGQLTFIVLPNHYYKIDDVGYNGGTATIVKWVETY